MKKKILKLLRVVDTILEKNNIKYWLDYGTLLGAIREKTVIAWDDEFDISLWNDNLDSFLELIPLGRVPAIGRIVILFSRNLTKISGLLPII